MDDIKNAERQNDWKYCLQEYRLVLVLLQSRKALSSNEDIVKFQLHVDCSHGLDLVVVGLALKTTFICWPQAIYQITSSSGGIFGYIASKAGKH